MPSLLLHVKAPFASFLEFSTSDYSRTFPVMPPSTARGFVLNVAGVDTAKETGPQFRVATGITRSSQVSAFLFQAQFVGKAHSVESLKKRKHLVKKIELGVKDSFAPKTREYLHNFEGVLGVEGSEDFLQRLRAGVRGEIQAFGCLFAGENDCMVSSLKVKDAAPAFWYEHQPMLRRAVPYMSRLPIRIDRKDYTSTVRGMFVRSAVKSPLPPPSAWVTV